MGHPRHGPRPSSSAARLAGGVGARPPSWKQFGAMAFAPYRPYVLAGFRRDEVRKPQRVRRALLEKVGFVRGLRKPGRTRDGGEDRHRCSLSNTGDGSRDCICLFVHIC